MVVESVDQLKLAFDAWRRTKKHNSEPAPDELAARACRAARVHGVGAVAKATKMTYERLRGGTELTGKRKAAVAVVPSYSRVEVMAPAATCQPLVEVEMVSGVKLRAFVLSPEAVGFLSSFCVARGGL